MRVAINALFWNQPATGSGQYVRRLVAHLAPLFPDLEMLLVAPRGQSIHRPPQQAEIVSTAGTARNGLDKLIYEQRAYVGSALDWSAELLHVPYFAPPRWSALPTIVTVHDLIPLLLRGYRGGPLVRAYTAWVSAAARRADRVLTDSRAAARDIIAHLGIAEERVQVIYLAADASFRPVPRETDGELVGVRERLHLPERYLLYLGGFDRRKQVPELLAAYAHSGLVTEWPLVVAGRLPASDSAFSPDPRPLVRTLGIQDAVQFTGWVDEADKPALYRGARAFMFPSVYEGFGLPVLEALACGTPVIACHGSSLDEVAGPGGLLVDATDSGALADAMRQLVFDDSLRESLSAAGLMHARQFNWDATASQTARAYREVLDG